VTARALVAGLPIAAIARALGPLREQVVFIGGAIAPLLHSERVFLQARATDDVDGVAATASYGDFHRLEAQLRQQGFRQDLQDVGHMHRWRSPEGLKFDLVPSGAHAGGIGNAVDQAAIRTAISLEIEPGLTIRHASAPAFLAQKLLAYRDRGRGDPLTSDDLTDILALVAARPGLPGEVSAAESEIRNVIVPGVQEITQHPDASDLLAGHLGDAQDAGATAKAVRERLLVLSRA